MLITCTVQLAETDTHFDLTVQEVADGVLKACGGDETIDTCNVSIVRPTAQASSGVPPPTEPPV